VTIELWKPIALEKHSKNRRETIKKTRTLLYGILRATRPHIVCTRFTRIDPQQSVLRW